MEFRRSGRARRASGPRRCAIIGRLSWPAARAVRYSPGRKRRPDPARQDETTHALTSFAAQLRARGSGGQGTGMTTTFDLSGKTAMVTGASSGLGGRFARVLADNGARVVLASRRTERLKEMRAEIESQGGSACVVPLDVTDVASIDQAVAAAEAEAGPIDVLVNNSGVSTTQRLVDVTPQDYDFVMNTN